MPDKTKEEIKKDLENWVNRLKKIDSEVRILYSELNDVYSKLDLK